MNKLLFQFVFFILLLFLWGCEDEKNETTPEIAPVSNITFEAGAGEILFKWQNPDYENISYVEITYPDDSDNIRRILINPGVTEHKVEGFGKNKTYEFTFTVFNNRGQSSIPIKVTVNARPHEPMLNMFNSKINIGRQNGGIIINWTNDYEEEFYIDVTYYDINKNRISHEIVVTDKGEGKEFVALSGVTETDLQISTSDIYGNSTEARIYHYKVFENGKLNPSQWTLSVSSVEEADGGPYIADYMLDGDLNTFWHSRYTSSPCQFPHTINIDLKRKVELQKFGFCHRQTSIQAKGVEIYGTNSVNGTYQKFMAFDLAQDKAMQYFTIGAPVVYRYIRIILTTSPSADKNAALAELEIWGSDIDE